ncbi:MAG: SDR family oxidoreductase [Novosphingobium sp.]
MEQLAGKVAIVTGAASGIGRGTALALARSGAKIVVADIDDAGSNETVRLICEAGGQARTQHIDVADDAAFPMLRDATLTHFGAIDIVMNNVGVITRGLPDHVPVEEWTRILDINLMSVVRSNAVFLPLLIGQGAGHIVNTASFAGLFGYSFDRLPYAAAKAAVVQISEGLALYLRPLGVGVTCLCPGPVRTNVMSSLREFGPKTDTRGPGPEFTLLDPDAVGEMVVDAIRANRFMLVTDQQVVPHLVARATDWDAFVERQIDRPFVVAKAGQ